MDTKQKTRVPQARTGTANRKKKKKTGLFGLGSSSAAKKTAAKPASSAPRQRTLSPEEAQRRREAAARRARQEAEAMAAQQNPAAETPAGDIQEVVYKPTAEEAPRIRTPEENKRSEMRRRSAKRSKARQEEAKRSEHRPQVTYTDPAPFNLQRLLLQLAVVAALVMAIVVGISVFFRVEKIVVYGNDAYSAWQIREKSEIEEGQNLLTFGSTRACGKIRTALPYIKSVRIGIKLPDTVNIYVEEYDVLYAIESGDGHWWLMTSTGKIVEQVQSGAAGGYTKVLGVKVESPVVGADAKAVEDLLAIPTDETTPEGETQPTEEQQYIVTGAQKLQAALLILDALELNDIVGEAASINVQSLTNLELMYGSRFQVKLGNSEEMEKKIAWMKSAIAQQNDYQTGILDCSFTTWTDQVGFTPNS